MIEQRIANVCTSRLNFC